MNLKSTCCLLLSDRDGRPSLSFLCLWVTQYLQNTIRILVDLVMENPIVAVYDIPSMRFNGTGNDYRTIKLPYPVICMIYPTIWVFGSSTDDKMVDGPVLIPGYTQIVSCNDGYKTVIHKLATDGQTITASSTRETTSDSLKVILFAA